jgi:hypothetical protein
VDEKHGGRRQQGGRVFNELHLLAKITPDVSLGQGSLQAFIRRAGSQVEQRAMK